MTATITCIHCRFHDGNHRSDCQVLAYERIMALAAKRPAARDGE